MTSRALCRCDCCKKLIPKEEINMALTYCDGGLLTRRAGSGPKKLITICDACHLLYSNFGSLFSPIVFPKFMTKEILE